jgi:hypothetical protein
VSVFRVGLLCLFSLSPLAQADNDRFTVDHYYLQAGTYTHYGDSEDYAGNNILASAEAVNPDDELVGLALFDNSFGQFSQYLYTGKSWNFSGNWQGFHTKLTAGLIHGYKGEFRNKIPLNSHGVAPAIVPSLGYSNDRYGADVIILGISGILFTVGTKL